MTPLVPGLMAGKGVDTEAIHSQHCNLESGRSLSFFHGKSEVRVSTEWCRMSLLSEKMSVGGRNED